MNISARNQIKGTITNIKKGAVNGIVTLESDGNIITSTISLGSIESLQLVVGKEAYAIVKSTEVMIGLGDLTLSARNQLPCTISNIKVGAVNSIIGLTLSDGQLLSSTISISAVDELKLISGQMVKAVIKSTSVMIAI